MISALRVTAAGSVLVGLTVVWVPVASADAVGSACNDWMKISTDSGSGERIFCAQARPGDPDSPLGWLAWDSPSTNWGSLPLVGPTASPYAAAPYTFGAR